MFTSSGTASSLANATTKINQHLVVLVALDAKDLQVASGCIKTITSKYQSLITPRLCALNYKLQ